MAATGSRQNPLVKPIARSNSELPGFDLLTDDHLFPTDLVILHGDLPICHLSQGPPPRARMLSF